MLYRMILLLLACCCCLVAQEKTVKVGLAHFPPNVAAPPGADASPEGFDVDIWREVARIIGVRSEFVVMPFQDLLTQVRNGQVDIALAGITMTAGREEQMDFSHPYMRSGLKILTRTEERSGLAQLVRSAFESGAVKAVGFLILLLAVCAHLLYFAERGSGAIQRRYFPGILEAAWCALATVTTVGYGDIAPRRWTGRLVAFIMMLGGIGVFGIVVAQLSAGLTTVRLKSAIQGPEDLKDKKIATVAGSIGADFAAGYGAKVRAVGVIEQAYPLLERAEVDAVVFDAPTLQDYVRRNEPEGVGLVGGIFLPHNYGIAFPEGSSLREPVNRALLRIKEQGTYDRIYSRWFGTD